MPRSSRGPGRRPGQIGDRELGVGARIVGLPAVQIGFDEVLRLVASREHEVGVEFGADRDAVWLVRRVPAVRSPRRRPLRGWCCAGRGCTRRWSSGCVRCSASGSDSDALGLASQRAAEHDVCPESLRQPRYPEALPAGVEMHLHAVAPGLGALEPSAAGLRAFARGGAYFAAQRRRLCPVAGCRCGP
jgi:hypothetical protein